MWLETMSLKVGMLVIYVNFKDLPIVFTNSPKNCNLQTPPFQNSISKTHSDYLFPSEQM